MTVGTVRDNIPTVFVTPETDQSTRPIQRNILNVPILAQVADELGLTAEFTVGIVVAGVMSAGVGGGQGVPLGTHAADVGLDALLAGSDFALDSWHVGQVAPSCVAIDGGRGGEGADCAVGTPLAF